MAPGLHGSTQASGDIAQVQLIGGSTFCRNIFIKTFSSSILSSEFETRRKSSDNWLIILVSTERCRFVIVFYVRCLTEARFRMRNISKRKSSFFDNDIDPF